MQPLLRTQKPLKGQQLAYGALADGLVGCWLMNEGSGGVYNIAQNINHETARVDVTWSAGKFGSCNSFPGGAGDYINCGGVDEQLKLITTDFTVLAWVYPDSVAATHIICGACEADNDGWYVGKENDTWAIWVDGSKAASASIVVANEWQQFVLTWEQHGAPSNVLRWYRNGVFDEADSGFVKDVPDSVGRNFVIGVDPRDYSDKAWDGLICHIMIWRRVLSASEIAQLYREPFAMFVPEWISAFELASQSVVGATMAGHYYRHFLGGAA
jgi:hypothetical protein